MKQFRHWLKITAKITILSGSLVFSLISLADNVVIDSPKPLPGMTPTPEPTTEDTSQNTTKTKKSSKSDEEEDKSEFLISTKYRNGAYLIYDCTKRHFACVNNEGFDECKQSRETALVNRRSRLPCAPLKKFKNQARCYKKQLNLIGQIPNKKFCLNKKRSLLN